MGSLTWLLTVTATTYSEATPPPAPPTGTIWPSRWTVRRSSSCGEKLSASQEALTPGISTTRCGECRWISRATTSCWEDPETSILTVQNLEAGPATSGSPTSWWSARTGTSCTRIYGSQAGNEAGEYLTVTSTGDIMIYTDSDTTPGFGFLKVTKNA